MAYVLGEYGGRWTGQTHLDLSTDDSAPENATLVGSLPIRTDTCTTQMSALCLASPTVANYVVLGTNMGIVYVRTGCLTNDETRALAGPTATARGTPCGGRRCGRGHEF